MFRPCEEKGAVGSALYFAARAELTVQCLETLLRIGSSYDQDSLFGMRTGRAVGVFDIHFGSRETASDFGQRPRLIIALDHQHFCFHDERAMFLKNLHG